MNIGIDITSAIYQRGVSRYTTNLAKALGKESNVNVSIFGYSLRQKNALIKIAKTINTKSTIILPFPQSLMSIIWKFGFKPVKQLLPEIDVFHSWDWLQPPDTKLPVVSTIHDLAILKFPKTAHPTILKAHQKSWDDLKKKKSHIIAVSRSTKKDVVELLGFPSYMVHVVHEALPVEFREISRSVNEEMASSIKSKLKLVKPYIFFVGTREPRKNLDRLIEAWQSFAETHELIIAGDIGWDDSEKEAKKYINQPRFVGRVTDQELSVLYAEADVFAYPSLYEGFGLPILESFHHGTPVLTSENSGMLEVAGNAAELINPESVESITKGLKKILEEEKPDQQKRLQRMIIRQQMFSWEKVSKETIAVYKRAIEDFEA